MGRFDVGVLASVIDLQERAYGVAIQDELESRLGKRIAAGQIYIVLGRLESKGFLKSAFGEPTAERGGRAKKYYRITAVGRRALAQEANAFRGLVGLNAFPQSL